MASQVTLTVSDTVMAQAQAVTEATGRSVEDVLSERLESTTVPVWTHPDHEKMAREIAAYEALHPELARTYLGRYVAIAGGTPVDDDSDRAALLARLAISHPGRVVLVRRVAPDLPADVHIPSVREARGEGT